MEKIISEHEHNYHLELSPQYRQFLKTYHSRALADMIRAFVSQNNYHPDLTMIKKIILASFEDI